MDERSLAAFVESLGYVPTGPQAFNQYEAGSEANAIRRKNLLLYLEQVRRRGSRVLLLGEAPGYQGCRRTGIPFTSEAIMLAGVPSLGMFGSDHGYRKTVEFERIRKEPSATIVWEALARFDFLPVLWSSFPFHPHKPDSSESNRTPTRSEVASGRGFALKLIEIMAIEQVVAVGNIAQQSLAAAGITADRIRHPAQGGKNDFVAGIRKLADERQRP